MHNTVRRLFIFSFALALAGLATIYTTSYPDGAFRPESTFFRQCLWLLLGIAAFFIFANFNYRKAYDLSFFLYGLSVVLLILVLLFGSVRFGAQRWLEVLDVNFQPSELAKFSLILFLASYLTRKDSASVTWQARNLGMARGIIIPGIFSAIPAFLILEQPDLGTAGIFVFIFLALIFVSGVKKRHIFLLFALIIAAMPVAWHFLKDYQKDRLLVFINPNIDPLGAGYTVIQSKIAVGSGRFFGRGWLSGTQNMLNFLPERHTDFIFSCFAEASGFLGALALLTLFYLLLKECLSVMRLTSDDFARLLAAGIITVISAQAVLNLAMTIGFFPVVGIPLPFVSYGGTSMLVNFIFIGIIASIAKRRMVF